jgi:DNA-binding HxlR family transcriptional regulator
MAPRASVPTPQSEPERIRRTFLENAVTIRRLHDRIHDTFRRRDRGPSQLAEWQDAAAEYRARYPALAFPGSYAKERIEGGDPDAMEAAVCFLECRPYFDRSGYMFEELLRVCRRAPLSQEQRARYLAIKQRYRDWRAVRQGETKAQELSVRVLHELRDGPVGFAALEAQLPSWLRRIANESLSARLADLEASGFIDKRLPAPTAPPIYALSKWGAQVGHILYIVRSWGGGSLLLSGDPAHPLRPHWLKDALRAFFRRGSAAGVTATVALELPDRTLALDFHNGYFRTWATPATAPDLTIIADEREFVALLSGGAAAAAARRGLEMTGKVGLVDTLVAAFPLGG